MSDSIQGEVESIHFALLTRCLGVRIQQHQHPSDPLESQGGPTHKYQRREVRERRRDQFLRECRLLLLPDDRGLQLLKKLEVLLRHRLKEGTIRHCDALKMSRRPYKSRALAI